MSLKDSKSSKINKNDKLETPDSNIAQSSDEAAEAEVGKMTTRQSRTNKNETSTAPSSNTNMNTTMEEVQTVVERAINVIRDEMNSAVEKAIQVMRGEFTKLFEDLSTKIQTFEDRVETLESRMDVLEHREQCDCHGEKEKIDDLTAEVQALRQEARDFAIAANENEQHQRRWNLRFKGLNVQDEDDSKKVVVEFVRRSLNILISEDDIENAHILPIRNASTTASSRASTRTNHNATVLPQIIARFKTREVRDKVIRNRRNLKDTNTAIVEDLTALNVKTMNRVKMHPQVGRVWSWNGRIKAKLQNDRVISVKPFQSVDSILNGTYS